MPPEPLPIDRKDLLKDRKPSSSEPVGVVPAKWREPPTTPSSHPNNHGSSLSCRGAGGGGPFDIRRPFSVGCQKDWKRGKSSETTAPPNGNSQPHSDFVNSMDQLQSNDQHAKNSGGGVSTTCGQRLEKGNSLGSSLDWKPLKWTRSGSLSSRGSGFSHSHDTKIEAQLGNNTPLELNSGDAAPCVTPRTSDDASSRKKARLGWGEGLAKYEKKKVDPDDIVDKEAGARCGMVDGVSSSEPLLSSPSNLPGKSPSLTECTSPTTPCSFACSSSPGLEEKTSITTDTVNNDTCNPSVASCHLSQNHTFNLENLELTEGFNVSSSLDELLQTDDTSAPGSGFAMDKLQVWKADISRTLEITESEIDSLEIELKSLISDAGGSSSFPADNKDTEERSMEKSDGFLEESPDISTFEFVEPHSDAIEQTDSQVDLNITSEKGECSQDHVSDDMLAVVHYRREGKLYDPIFASNKDVANSASDELSKIFPTTQLCSNISRPTDVSLIKERFAMRKRFLKFKERAITLKFRALQYSWKEDLRLLSMRRSGAKSHKKFESSSRVGYADNQKHHISIHSRLSSPVGSSSLVPTTEIVEYVNKLLSDSRVRTHREVLKMPSFILDKRERLTSRFISSNGFVENPVDVEKEKSIVNPWTVEDKELFLEKYYLFGKNFRKIASTFQHKTVADCVEFYYKNHKSDYFHKTKKNPEFAKGNSHTTNTYLVTSGKQRLNRLDMLGSASAMVANVDGVIRTSSDKKLARADATIIERSNDFAIYCNEQEAAAADVLAGICGSISSEALGSCITSSVDQVRRCQKLGGSSLNDVDEETCSDDSCGEEMDSSIWTDEEKSSFVKAVRCYGKDFSMVSRFVRTRSGDQCKLFFSKARKCLGLDVIGIEGGSEGTTGANQGGGSGSDHDGACMVDSGSVISNEKSSGECKIDVEDLHSSDSKQELAESDLNAVNDCREPENFVSHGCEVDNKPGERRSNGNLEGAADSEATEAVNPEESPQNTCSDSASGAKVEPAKICIEGIRESEHELRSVVRGSSICPVEDLNSASYYSRGSIDHGTDLDLNASSENVSSQEAGNGLVMSNLFPRDPSVIPKRRTLSQDDVSSRLSFRKSGQRSSSTDGYLLHLPKRSLLDCAESSPILQGCSANKGMNGSLIYNDPQRSNFKLDESLLMPRDDSIQTSVSQEPRQSSLSDVEKPSRSGDVKLFGQILTNNSSNKLQHPLPKANGSEKPNVGKSFNLKFDHHSTHRKLASLDVDQNKDYAFGVERNRQLSSHGFWDGSRIQTGFPSLPDSAVLLAKYPAAFQDQQLLSSVKIGNEQGNLNVVPGFPTRKLSSNNGSASYHVYGRQEVMQPFTVDKFLLPEMPRRKELEALSSVQQGRGVNVVGGACNGVSDPVAAIRLHYAAKTQQYKNGGGEPWRSSSSDIGSR